MSSFVAKSQTLEKRCEICAELTITTTKQRH